LAAGFFSNLIERREAVAKLPSQRTDSLMYMVRLITLVSRYGFQIPTYEGVSMIHVGVYNELNNHADELRANPLDSLKRLKEKGDVDYHLFTGLDSELGDTEFEKGLSALANVLATLPQHLERVDGLGMVDTKLDID